ncbi:MAG: EAL domain-containing protein [Chloroflexi bacterium]|nr:EAL domain-containing protein [Chloroflexota bacterium]
MQPYRSDPAESVDEFVEGHNGLRLVKLRLGLTLIAVAVLPLAALAPLARSVLDDPRVAQRERLNAQSDLMATETRRELEGLRSALLDVAAVPRAGSLFGAKPDGKAAVAVTAQLNAVLARPSGLVSTIAIVDPAGTVILGAGDSGAAFSDLPPPQPRASPFRFVGSGEDTGSGGDTGSRLEVTVPIQDASGDSPLGMVIADVPLDSILAWLNADFATSADRLSVLDGSGLELAGLTTNADLSPGSAPSLEFTADPSTRAIGASELGVPGIAGWRLVGSAPMTVAVVPLIVIAVLALLLALLVIFIVLMARQILAPAIALEEQRAHFQTLYLSAREAALQDHLTGLGNHRAFQEALSRMVEQARRHSHRFALVLLDIDEFKRVNDTRGHAVGDELLVEVGNLIRSTIRGSDAGFRIGGDEFAVLLAETDSDGAAITVRRILSRGLEARVIGRYQGPISFSAGVTSCPDLGQTRVELTAQADAALYRGKRAGRTLVSIYDPMIDHGHVDEGMRAELSMSISAVIESGGLSPVYQPIVHLPTGRILGYEGLVRVRPDSGFPHTGALFDAAEIAGRVLDLDKAALEVVLRGADAIPPETLVSLNVSPRSFEAPEFTASTLLAILRRHAMAPERVILELTERDAIRDPDRLRGIIHALQDAGVRIAADDVGAGNAGLRLLSQFRFDVVKIDLSLVQGGASKDQTMSVLTTLVDLARRWGALTIAEGVETPLQLQMIRQLEIDAGQGYLLGRPAVEIDTSDLDLDALSGSTTRGDRGGPTRDLGASPREPGALPREPGASPREPGVSPRTAPARPSFEVTPASASPVPASAGPVPTAASVLAGHRPNSFGAP